jgi:ribosomal protein S18 acetylase RimI-like enzyme
LTRVATIRHGTVADAPALAAFAARTFEETFRHQSTESDMAAHLEKAYGVAQQTAELPDPDVTTLLAHRDGTLVAFAQLRRTRPAEVVPDRDAIELQRFYVDRPAHGTGLAQTLMAAAFDAARAAGARHVWLGVFERNPRAIAFYRKCGFRDVGSHIFMLGSDPQRDRVMLATVP